MTFFILVSVPFGVGRERLRQARRPEGAIARSPQQRTDLRVQCQMLSGREVLG